MLKLILLSVLSLFATDLFAAPPDVNSELSQRSHAIILVADAARMFQQDGDEKALAEISNSKGKFVKGDVYVFAYTLDGKMAAHPMDSSLIGQYFLDKADARGKLFSKEIFDGVAKNHEVWVDYAFKNPVSGKIEDKTTYARAICGKYILASGFYRDK
jgi:cytochrome c